MKLLLFTEAWHPQVNGVVTAYENFVREFEKAGHEVKVVHPYLFAEKQRFSLPSYPEIEIARPPFGIKDIVEQEQPDAIHIATEGPLGYMARRYCIRHGLNFTTACHTKFSEYIGARVPLGSTTATAVSKTVLRRFHKPALATFATSKGMKEELERNGFSDVVLWERGIDRERFNSSYREEDLGLPRPVFLYAGRVAVEKNLEAFLACDLPGSKVIVGDGPARADLEKTYGDAQNVHFPGHKEHGPELARWMASADVFVFPSLTDTFGLVMLESISCGTPVACYDTYGAREMLEPGVNGYYGDDLEKTAERCLAIDREKCMKSAEKWDWSRSVETFLRVWGHEEES